MGASSTPLSGQSSLHGAKPRGGVDSPTTGDSLALMSFAQDVRSAAFRPFNGLKPALRTTSAAATPGRTAAIRNLVCSLPLAKSHFVGFLYPPKGNIGWRMKNSKFRRNGGSRELRVES